MNLAELKNGDKAIIIKVRGRGAFRKRIMEMGFVRGKEIEVIKNAPLRDPIEYKLMDYNVSLRRSEATHIMVTPLSETSPGSIEKTPRHIDGGPFHHGHPPGMGNSFRLSPRSKEQIRQPGMFPGRGRRRKFMARHQLLDSSGLPMLQPHETDEKTIHIALVGNPNCGKTTLFNHLAGAKERVGNYSGVTVGAKQASFQHGDYTFNIVDLPGTYSITEYTPEELFVRRHILENTPDVVINVVDASNLERNLYLTTQLIDMDIKVVVALNIYDELTRKGDTFDFETLGKMIGIPFVPTVSSKGLGTDDLIEKVKEVYEDRDETLRHIHINYGHEIERSIEAIQKEIKTEDNYALTDMVSSRFLAIKLLEKDRPAEERIFEQCQNRTKIFHEATEEILRLESLLKEDTESIMADAKYAFISGALHETLIRAKRPARTTSEKIDLVVTHAWLGIPLFILFMWLTFQLTFSLGAYPMNWIDQGMSWIASTISTIMAPGLLKDLLANGIIAGIGGVIIFLPNILILFFLISFMEDTGYMARAAFIMDKAMHRIGLHGKSFIPMLMGFGCNVPAIMATRTIESRNDRLLTMLITPFMSCSARLPVYVLFISAFFAQSAGTMLFVIYLTGVLVAGLSGILLKKTIFRAEEVPFVMELPPYRKPQLKTITKHMWEKAVEYLKKIGGVILVASILIWALGKFPLQPELDASYSQRRTAIEAQYKKKITEINKEKNIRKEGSAAALQNEKNTLLYELRLAHKQEYLQNSCIGGIGSFFEPVMRPLGFDWKMTVSVITGLAAKEVVVGTMGVLYQAGNDESGQSVSLTRRLQGQVYEAGTSKGKKVFTPLVAFVFILFILLYFPCIAVLATIRRESGSWKWAAFSAFYSTSVAWLVTFFVYRIGLYIAG